MHLRTSRRAYLRTCALGTIAVLLPTADARSAPASPTDVTANTDGWRPQPPPLATLWTGRVGPDNAHPEYPRPQMTRPRWRSLNGVWQYSTGPAPESGRDLPERILVPYPPESALSGIQRHDDRMWYRRTFDVPADWRDQRLLLHFGAVDQTARVWVNGWEVARHSGGFAEFSADVTAALRAGGAQELLVEAIDHGDAAPDGADFPVGKQTREPGGIHYTQSSGIWQTVWMEPVPESHVAGLDVEPRPGERAFVVTARTAGPIPSGARAEAVLAEPGGPELARATGAPDSPLRLELTEPRWWSPGDPHLYDLRVRLLSPAGDEFDAVSGYAGMRSISLLPDERGRPRLALNGRILFQLGVLDQGFWPDGLHTAPTDAALRSDLERAKQLGFNMVRKHAKVEPRRWYYWADRLGLLVWQDMPSLPSNGDTPQPNPIPPSGSEAKRHFKAGLDELVAQHRNSPALVVWVPFNEGWGEFDTADVARRVARADPTRLVDAASGVNCCHSLPDSGAGDFDDDHTYVGPGRPRATGHRAAVDGEYGGFGLAVDGHLWPGEPSAYEMTHDAAELGRRYGDVQRMLARLVPNNGISAAVYTQISDVENEVNGLLTYDRAVLKPDAAAVLENNLRVIEAGSE